MTRSQKRTARRFAVVATAFALLCAGAFAAYRAYFRDAFMSQNLVLVVVDTLRADRLSVSGYDRPTTPFLDSLAAESIRFADLKAAAPWTIPAHASLFTGLTPAQHHAQWGQTVLGPEFVTLAEVLQDAGYRTVGLSANGFIQRRFGFAQGFDWFDTVTGPHETRSERLLAEVPTVLWEARQARKPLFLFINLMDVHIPYNVGEYGPLFGADGPGPAAEHKWEISAGTFPFGDAEKQAHVNAYDAAVRTVDDRIRDLVGILSENGMRDDTLLVVTSDHGDGLGTHPEIGHCISVYEEQLAIPLLVRRPDGIGAGTVYPHRTTQVVMAPTLLDLLGVARPPSMQRSPDLFAAAPPVTADYRSYFTEIVRNKNASVAERYPELAGKVRHTHVAYCNSYKLVVDASGQESVFDLATDPNETRDVSPTADSQELNRCRNVYRELEAEGQFTPFDMESIPGADSVLDVEDTESLKALGYLQ